jgi:hypothetical protein
VPRLQRCCGATKDLQNITHGDAKEALNLAAGFLDACWEGAMAKAGFSLEMSTHMDDYLALIERSEESCEAILAVQRYLASWPEERIANVQKIDAGWAPFDTCLRPLQINGALDVRCIRDAIHCQCMALREARVALMPELTELDEFFFIANEIIESKGRTQLRLHTSATPSHHAAFANP